MAGANEPGRSSSPPPGDPCHDADPMGACGVEQAGPDRPARHRRSRRGERSRPGRRRQAADHRRDARPGGSPPGFRRPADRGPLGRRAAAQPDQHVAGPDRGPTPAAGSRRRAAPLVRVCPRRRCRRHRRPSPRAPTSPPAAMRPPTATTIGRPSSSAAPLRWRGARRSARLLDHDFARAAAARIDELVLAAHTGLIDAELAAGRHEDVLPTLGRPRRRPSAVGALPRPADDRPVPQRSPERRLARVPQRPHGPRRGDGDRPGPELQALERAVLTHDAALSAPAHLRVRRAGTPPGGDDLVRRPRRRPRRAGRRDVAASPRHRRRPRRRRQDPPRPRAPRPATAARGDVVRGAGRDRRSARRAGGDRGDARRSRHRAGERGGATPDVRSRRPHRRRAGRRSSSTTASTSSTSRPARPASSSTACPRLRIIATSRQPLDVAGEHQLPLDPLDDVAAAQLFTERAIAVRPRSRAEPDDVSPTCAASSTASRSPSSWPRLASRRCRSASSPPGSTIASACCTALDGTPTERHRGLGAAIDWSFDALFEDERQVFCRLAVFAGGATLEAAERGVRSVGVGASSRGSSTSRSSSPTPAARRRGSACSSRCASTASSASLPPVSSTTPSPATGVVHRARRGGRARRPQRCAPSSTGSPVSTPSTTTCAPRFPARSRRWLPAPHRRPAPAVVAARARPGGPPLGRQPPGARAGRARAVVAKAEAWCGLLRQLDRVARSHRRHRARADHCRRNDNAARSSTTKAPATTSPRRTAELLLAFNILRRGAAGHGSRARRHRRPHGADDGDVRTTTTTTSAWRSRTSPPRCATSPTGDLTADRLRPRRPGATPSAAASGSAGSRRAYRRDARRVGR